MCNVVMTVMHIVTDKPNDSDISGDYRVINFSLENCNQDDEKYKKYMKIEALIEYFKKLTLTFKDEVNSVLIEKSIINLTQPFLVWFAKERYDSILLKQIEIEKKDDKIKRIVEVNEVAINELKDDFQKIYHEVKDFISDKIDEYLVEIKKILESHAYVDDIREIKQSIEITMMRYKKILSDINNIATIYENELSKLNEKVKQELERAINERLKKEDKKLRDYVVDEIETMKNRLEKKINRVKQVATGAIDKLKGLFKRDKKKNKDIDNDIENNIEKGIDNDLLL